MVTDDTETPECVDEGVTISHNFGAEEAAPSTATFAFAAWKVGLELMLQQEMESLHESVQTLQSEFDDRSQFVRGDFAWRKQILTFHDQLQDVLTTHLNVLSSNVGNHAAQVSESLAQTLAKVERDGQRAVRQEEQKGEMALRRTRAALGKEVERVARLEKCLRLEEARQAAATLAERERQLLAEHTTRESQLQALLGDMRSSNDSLEILNSQLLEAIQTSRTELEQLRNTLIKSMSRAKRKSSSPVQVEGRNTVSESAAAGRGGGDKAGKNSTFRGLESFSSAANDLLLVPTLRQSLSAATQAVVNLKSRVVELESAHGSEKQRLRDAQLSVAQAENERAKAMKLLGEARSKLIENEKKLVQAAEERMKWQDQFDTLQALEQGKERALVDSQRLEEATQEQLALLTSRIQRIMIVESRQRDFELAVDEWKQKRFCEEKDEENVPPPPHDDKRSLENIVNSFLLDTNDVAQVVDLFETPKELQVRLRYEFERQFGKQLNLRVSYERRRVLERLERTCAAEAKERQGSSQRTRQSVSRVNCMESDFSRLKRLVKIAYNQLGICVGGWSETDLDGLYARLNALQSQVQTLEQTLEAAHNDAESQRVLLVRAQLAQQEKSLLLAELTARYRQLQAAHKARCIQRQLYERKRLMERTPLTVHGIPQTLTQKPKMHAIMQLPLRQRPASAAACLGSAYHQPLRRISPPPSRLGSNNICQTNLVRQNMNKGRAGEVEEHVRSVLKSTFMRPDTEIYSDDTVGSDGVLEILHRRRHRK